jgi:hypothetical protein
MPGGWRAVSDRQVIKRIVYLLILLRYHQLSDPGGVQHARTNNRQPIENLVIALVISCLLSGNGAFAIWIVAAVINSATLA